MNKEHLKIIADQLQFKLAAEPVQQIPSGPGGGHSSWKIKADNKFFFIKQLDPKFDIHDKKIIARYELCESVASRFAQQRISAVCALRNDDKTVIILENTAYLVYPWIEGYTLQAVSAEHAIKIAETLAQIHVANLDVPEIEPKFDTHTNEEIIVSLEKAISREASLAIILMENQDTILSMNDRYLAAIPVLKEKTMITHGDLFAHNVIWQSPDRPFLIDWEAIKKWNPTREAVRTCAAWSSIGGDHTSISLFEKMLKKYISYGGPFEKNHVEAALNGMYGGAINWLLYNLDLVCSSGSDRKEKAIKEIDRTLISSEKLTKLHSLLFNLIMQHF